MTAAWLFWAAFAFLVYTFLGFPLLLAVRALLFRRPPRRGVGVEAAVPRTSRQCSARDSRSRVATLDSFAAIGADGYVARIERALA